MAFVRVFGVSLKTRKGVWVCSWRDEAKRVKYVDQVLEALCFGWIDSTCKSLDEQRLIQLFTPRRAKSTWSSLNKQRVAELEEKGLMTDAGRASIETAKANGHWSILESVEALEEPEELADALDATKHARKHWDAFPASEKKIQLLSIKTAQRQETREKRIAQIVEKAARNERPKKYAKKKD